MDPPIPLHAARKRSLMLNLVQNDASKAKFFFLEREKLKVQ